MAQLYSATRLATTTPGRSQWPGSSSASRVRERFHHDDWRTNASDRNPAEMIFLAAATD